jgi:hypothetical protein
MDNTKSLEALIERRDGERPSLQDRRLGPDPLLAAIKQTQQAIKKAFSVKENVKVRAKLKDVHNI